MTSGDFGYRRVIGAIVVTSTCIAQTATSGGYGVAGELLPPQWFHLAQADTSIDPKVTEDESWIGIEFSDVTSKAAKRNGLERPAGAHVFEVAPLGGAAKAGMRVNDIVLAVDGKAILDSNDLEKSLDEIWPGRTVRFVVLRSGRKTELDVTLGSLISDNLPAAKAGDARAMHMIGIAYAYGRGTRQNFRKAAKWYRKSAVLGNAASQLELATLYVDGDGVPKDHAKVVRWLRKAARQNYGRAQTYLAQAYQSGRGVEQNNKVAITWYRKAVQNGDGLAAVNLGLVYAKGTGVMRDDAKAAAYFRRAIEHSNVAALHYLAFFHWHGRGVGKNKNEAARLWRLGSLKGNKNATKMLAKFNIETFDAAELQRLLKVLGYDPGAIDGRPGRKTKSAIRQFQTKRGLAVNGTPSLQVYGSLLIAEQALRRAELVRRYELEKAVVPELNDAELEDDLDLLE